jgi:DNA-directed RNA polymerase subunit H (RpoH/RPB5)
MMFVMHGSADRPNPAVDYSWAVVVHGGIRAQQLRQQLQRCVSLVQKLREQTAPRQGFDDPTQLKVRIVLVAWGVAYHPVQGAGITRLRATIRDLTVKAAENGDGISYELFSVHELLFDATDHVDVASVEVVRDTSLHRCLRHVKPYELPYIKQSDIQARLRDLRPGQIVRVERRDLALGGLTEEFRYVIDQ